MTSHERVIAAFESTSVDRIPRFDSSWHYPDDWARRFGPVEELSDISIWVPQEGAFPTRARVLRVDGDWTVREYKEAGARYVVLHSDGNVLPILDMLVDAGTDGLNPLEKRAGMEAVRERYPNLILIGGMCNTDTLINGPAARIEAETRQLIDLGRNGGFVIGTHSISPEIPIEFFEVYHRTCLTYGDFGNGHYIA